MQSRTLLNSKATGRIAGGLRRATVLAGRRTALRGSSDRSTVTTREASPTALTTARSPRGLRWLRLPFAPEIVLPALKWFHDIDLRVDRPYGFKASFNPTYPDESGSEHGWVSPFHFGLNQGPIVLMIENYRSGLLWRLMRQCPYLVAGLRRAGFRNGWL